MTVNIIPITDFRNRAKEILAKLEEMPVILTQRSRPTAVLVDYAIYNEREERLTKLELMVDELVLSRAIESATEFISLEELFADYESFGGENLAQPD